MKVSVSLVKSVSLVIHTYLYNDIFTLHCSAVPQFSERRDVDPSLLSIAASKYYSLRLLRAVPKASSYVECNGSNIDQHRHVFRKHHTS